MRVPRLRFKEFSGEWQVNTIGCIASSVSAGATPSTTKREYWGGDIRWMNSGEINLKRVYEVENRITEAGLKNSSTKILPVESVLIGLAGQGKTRGTVAINYVPLCTNQSIAAIQPNPKYFVPEFLYQNLDNRYLELRSMSTGDGGRGGLNLQIIKSVPIALPGIPEQKKIASFISAVDQKISLLTKRHELLIHYKKGVMQKIFNQEIRFKDKDGKDFPEWSTRRLGEIAERVKRKNIENNQNVLTISAQQGLVNQQEYFTKSVAAKDVSGYYLLESGDFAYNKSYSKGYPMGAIKRLKLYPKGVVSTLYICFRLNDLCDESFFEHYFDAGIQNQEIESVAQEGARNHGLLNIGIEDFFGIGLSVPSLTEQKIIGHFLNALDKKITGEFSYLNLCKLYKQGLLQQMFI